MKVTFAQLQALYVRFGGVLIYDMKDSKVSTVVFGQASAVPIATLVDTVTEAEFTTAFPGVTVRVNSVKD